MRVSPMTALRTSWPVGKQIFIAHTGGGPVLEMVPAVVSIDTLKPTVTVFSGVSYTQRTWYACALNVMSLGCFWITRMKFASPFSNTRPQVSKRTF